MERFTKRTVIPAPASAVFDWHDRPGALHRLLPPWQGIRILGTPGGIRDGERTTLKLNVEPGVWVKWVAEHFDYVPGEQFRDRQVKGPFKHWVHTHRVETIDEQSCALIDDIEYDFPMNPFGRFFGGGKVKQDLQQTFGHRHEITAEEVVIHQAYTGPKLTVGITGSSGMIGQSLASFLETGGHTVKHLTRREARDESEITCDLANGKIDREGLKELDAVVHLAGEPVVGRWSATKKKRIKDSRIENTRVLAEAVAEVFRESGQAGVMLSASAIGYYGNRDDEELTETSPPGKGFFPEVCEGWEMATGRALDAGVRVVPMRFGIVLHPQGGALKQSLPPFKAGVAGPFGNGKHYWSWISLDDAVRMMFKALTDAAVSGAMNGVSPQPVTNRVFAKTLGKVLRRPAVIPAPALALKLVFGEMAEHALLASQRVLPAAALEVGYGFKDTDLETTLTRMLGKKRYD